MGTPLSGLTKIAATIGTLEKAWRTGSKGRLIRKDYGHFSAGEGLANAMPTGKVGPITVTNSKEGPSELKKARGKFLIEGSPLKGIIKKVFKGKKGKELKVSGKAERGMNNTMNLHELDEMKNMGRTDKRNPQSQAGANFGHHSLSKVLGPEHNRAVTASDSTVKKGSKLVGKFRKVTGEAKAFNDFSLTNSKGKKPFKYGKGERITRAHKQAMYKKELGVPAMSKGELAAATGGKSKAERTMAYAEKHPNNKNK